VIHAPRARESGVTADEIAGVLVAVAPTALHRSSDSMGAARTDGTKAGRASRDHPIGMMRGA
jgi:hypothetical protein